MNRPFTRKIIVFTLILNLMAVGAPQMVSAELIGTQALVEAQERQNRIARIHATLAREDIRNQFVKMGVDPREAQERVAALTDTELVTLEQHLEDLPVAGTNVLAVIGVVFIILIILELVGVTNIFTRI